MTAGVGNVAVGQRNDSRRIRLPELGTGAWLSGNGTVLAGGGLQRRGWGRNRWVTDRFSQAKAHSITWRTITAARSKSFSTYKQKVVSNHKGLIPPHSCRPAHRPVRITDDRSSSAPRQS